MFQTLKPKDLMSLFTAIFYAIPAPYHCERVLDSCKVLGIKPTVKVNLKGYNEDDPYGNSDQ